MPLFPTPSSRFIFFGGKGGVGKTTCAAAAALRLAATGSRVLVLSLDPAHSLRDVLAADTEPSPGQAPADLPVEVVELDARRQFEEFMRAHRRELQTLADRGTYFDDEDIQGFLDLSLPGVDEIAALLKLGELAGDETGPSRVVVDLPPTGHALALFDVSMALQQLVRSLELMQDKYRFAVSSLTGRYVNDTVDDFVEHLRAACRAAEETLRNSALSSFILVARPDPMIVSETGRYAAQLRQLGVPLTALVMNAVSPGGRVELAEALLTLPLLRVPLFDQPPVGAFALRAVATSLFGDGSDRRPRTACARQDGQPDAAWQPRFGLAPLLADHRRLLIFGGKGGVGKTTLAAATAIALARRSPSSPIVLVSIDPAHSLSDSLGVQVGSKPVTLPGIDNLQAWEPDARQSWQEITSRWPTQPADVFRGMLGSSRLDPVYDRQIAEALGRIEPTGLAELHAAAAIVDLLDEDPKRLVVVDAAPTGHLLRFLETPEVVVSWTKELMRVLLKYDLAIRLRDLSEELLSLSRKAKRLQLVLRDAASCEVVVVTLSEPAVMRETERLLLRLHELGVPARYLVVNQVPPRSSRSAAGRHMRTAPATLPARFSELRAMAVERQPHPVQGIRMLEALAA